MAADRLFGTVLLAAVTLGASTSPADGPRVPLPGSMQGIIISTHGDGRDWSSDQMAPTMGDIKDLGAGWVAIHPYAGIRSDGRVRFREIDPGNPPAHIVRPIEVAHSQGLKILIKPHLAYWGSRYKWRGEIGFESDAEWARFFDEYERWIVLLAEVARKADAFVVGTELDLTLSHEERWRRIIRRVRDKTPAPLTYGANWSEYARVPFWDALDAIGVHAYFPLTDGEDRSAAAIRRGWTERMKELRQFSRKHDRPVLFTELGYNRSFDAPVRPWDDRTDGEAAAPLQELCLEIALEAVAAEPSVIGAFLWKWFPRPHSLGRNFQLATPGMTRVIREAWVEAPTEGAAR